MNHRNSRERPDVSEQLSVAAERRLSSPFQNAHIAGTKSYHMSPLIQVFDASEGGAPEICCRIHFQLSTSRGASSFHRPEQYMHLSSAIALTFCFVQHIPGPLSREPITVLHPLSMGPLPMSSLRLRY